MMQTLTLAQIKSQLGEWNNDTLVEGLEAALRPAETEGDKLRECTLFVRPNGFQVTSDQDISKPRHFAVPFDELEHLELADKALKVPRKITYATVPTFALFFFLCGRLLGKLYLKGEDSGTIMGLIWLPLGIIAGLLMVGKSPFFERYYTLSFCMKNGEELSLLVHAKQYKKASQFLKDYLPEKS